MIRPARDFSILGAEFADAEHLRIEEISPSAATRRPSRVRTGAETVALALGGGEGLAPQVLSVRFSYFSGRVAWRPILVSILALVLGNLMGAFMFTREIARLSRRWFHVERRDRGRAAGGAVPEDVLSRIVPGETTRAEVIRWCGPPGEERSRLGSGEHRTLLYRAIRRVPHRRLRVGWLATVSRWDEEHHEVAIARGRAGERRGNPRPLLAAVRRAQRLACATAGAPEGRPGGLRFDTSRCDC